MTHNTEDTAALADCLYAQHLEEALEKGIHLHDSIFETDQDYALKLLSTSKHVLIRNSAWAYIIGSNFWAGYLDPITKYDVVITGKIGAFNGCELYTDAFLPPHLKDQTPESENRVIFVPHDLT